MSAPADDNLAHILQLFERFPTLEERVRQAFLIALHSRNLVSLD